MRRQRRRRRRPGPGGPAPAPEPAAPVSTGGDGCTADGRIVTPVSGGTVTGQFGEDRGDHAHSGTDIAVPTGTTVRAANCGTVSVSGTESGYGQMVCIRHAGETTTCYAHLSERDVAVNEHVQAGQKIGEVGCTGSCTGPHVHFEVRQNGTATNPAPYLNGSQTVSGEATTANRAALPEGEGGTGGATPAEQAAVFGDTGGAAAPAAEVAPAARGRSAEAPAPAARGPAPAPREAPRPPPQPAPAPVAEAPAPVAEAPAPVAEAPGARRRGTGTRRRGTRARRRGTRHPPRRRGPGTRRRGPGARRRGSGARRRGAGRGVEVAAATGGAAGARRRRVALGGYGRGVAGGPAPRPGHPSSQGSTPLGDPQAGSDPC